MSVREFFDGWKIYKWVLLILMAIAMFWHGTYALRVLGADRYLISVPAARPMGHAIVTLDDVRRRVGDRFENRINETCKIGLQGGCPTLASWSRFILGMT